MHHIKSMEERKYVCKYCSKRFPCGKSLGGHIRTHMMMTEERSNVADGGGGNNMFIKLDGVRNNNNKKRDLWCEDEDDEEDDDDDVYDVVGNNHPSYGLRENPKKTMRFVHSSSGAGVNSGEQQQKEDKRFCKECGKGFPSLKALCGHMACHSEKEKRTTMRFEEVSDDKKKLKLVMDSQSDTETCAPTTHPRRSKRMRVKTINLSNHTFSPLPPPSSSSLVPLANSSSPVSEVEQEQEEVARCLMLLSRDSGFKGRFASVTESSDNNSVILEAKSSSPDTRTGVRNGNHNNNNNNIVSNHAYDLVEKKLLKVKDTKFRSTENSGSRCFRYGTKTKMVDSDVSNNEEFKWPKLGDKSRKYTASVVKKLVMEDLDYDTTDEITRRFDSRKRSLVGVSSNKNIANGFGNEVVYNENGRKGWKHEFLEGERDMNGSYDSIEESDENSSETESFPAPRSHKSKGMNGNKSSTKAKKKKKFKSKKSKEHECPICYKIFKSGQALGGHKRSHFIGGSEENTVVIKHVAPCLIDLNLPAPVDE